MAAEAESLQRFDERVSHNTAGTEATDDYAKKRRRFDSEPHSTSARTRDLNCAQKLPIKSQSPARSVE
jgi:hypothetical protein